eukprot:gnl/TRDRNA2_/TRDRNA2_147084_c3_seq1.p1 gnl/TRDRNA2_/TRDRNA2_147084_c3~~gnl/TRDRNA2_/TRDRNA2_147084_c3_seq1.p1  ORF type:complete len:1100 (+),score=275.57 gnl/TRDRNA2_/TRDRNA2_147084_c3_seq1:219-3518(+)
MQHGASAYMLRHLLASFLFLTFRGSLSSVIEDALAVQQQREDAADSDFLKWAQSAQDTLTDRISAYHERISEMTASIDGYSELASELKQVASMQPAIDRKLQEKNVQLMQSESQVWRSREVKKVMEKLVEQDSRMLAGIKEALTWEQKAFSEHRSARKELAVAAQKLGTAPDPAQHAATQQQPVAEVPVAQQQPPVQPQQTPIQTVAPAEQHKSPSAQQKASAPAAHPQQSLVAGQQQVQQQIQQPVVQQQELRVEPMMGISQLPALQLMQAGSMPTPMAATHDAVDGTAFLQAAQQTPAPQLTDASLLASSQLLAGVLAGAPAAPNAMASGLAALSTQFGAMPSQDAAAMPQPVSSAQPTSPHPQSQPQTAQPKISQVQLTAAAAAPPAVKPKPGQASKVQAPVETPSAHLASVAAHAHASGKSSPPKTVAGVSSSLQAAVPKPQQVGAAASAHIADKPAPAKAASALQAPAVHTPSASFLQPARPSSSPSSTAGGDAELEESLFGDALPDTSTASASTATPAAPTSPANPAVESIAAAAAPSALQEDSSALEGFLGVGQSTPSEPTRAAQAATASTPSTAPAAVQSTSGTADPTSALLSIMNQNGLSVDVPPLDSSAPTATKSAAATAAPALKDSAPALQAPEDPEQALMQVLGGGGASAGTGAAVAGSASASMPTLSDFVKQKTGRNAVTPQAFRPPAPPAQALVQVSESHVEVKDDGVGVQSSNLRKAVVSLPASAGSSAQSLAWHPSRDTDSQVDSLLAEVSRLTGKQTAVAGPPPAPASQAGSPRKPEQPKQPTPPQHQQQTPSTNSGDSEAANADMASLLGLSQGVFQNEAPVMPVAFIQLNSDTQGGGSTDSSTSTVVQRAAAALQAELGQASAMKSLAQRVSQQDVSTNIKMLAALQEQLKGRQLTWDCAQGPAAAKAEAALQLTESGLSMLEAEKSTVASLAAELRGVKALSDQTQAEFVGLIRQALGRTYEAARAELDGAVLGPLRRVAPAALAAFEESLNADAAAARNMSGGWVGQSSTISALAEQLSKAQASKQAQLRKAQNVLAAMQTKAAALRHKAFASPGCAEAASTTVLLSAVSHAMNILQS